MIKIGWINFMLKLWEQLALLIWQRVLNAPFRMLSVWSCWTGVKLRLLNKYDATTLQMSFQPLQVAIKWSLTAFLILHFMAINIRISDGSFLPKCLPKTVRVRLLDWTKMPRTVTSHFIKKINFRRCSWGRNRDSSLAVLIKPSIGACI